MPSILKIISKAPLPKRWKLEWQRTLLSRAYSNDVTQARKANNGEKVRELESGLRFEMELHEEDEDSYFTNALLRKARKLRVPIPHKKDEAGEESEYWYQGHYTGGWYLTNNGISALRKEIRGEIKARHESRSKWVVWVSALTGVIGAITGLVAVLSKAN